MSRGLLLHTSSYIKFFKAIMLAQRQVILKRALLIQRNLVKSPQLGSLISQTGGRFYSNQGKNTGKRNEPEYPGFKKFSLIAIIGTVVFVSTVRTLDDNKQKLSMSQQEYDHSVNGLKRRVSIFAPEELKVQLMQSRDPMMIKKVTQIQQLTIIDPREIVIKAQNDASDPYEPLLGELLEKYGPQDYIDNLPTGMLVMLLGRYMRQNCHRDDQVLIIDFPKTLKEAIKFENDISIIEKLVVAPGSDTQSNDVAKYYATVDKINQL